MAQLLRDEVVLAYDQAGEGDPALVFVHGLSCHGGFWTAQLTHFAASHRVLGVDLRGHGDSDAPRQRYTITGFADDLAWICAELDVACPVVVGHSLGGLVALELSASYPGRLSAAVLIDSVLLPTGNRASTVDRLVARLRGDDPDRALHQHFSNFFGPDDSPATKAWILAEAERTPAHVTSSVWEESLDSWDDAEALARVPLLYLDAGTSNADLARAVELNPRLMIGRTVDSGHFSPLEVPDQINAMLERFLSAGVDA